MNITRRAFGHTALGAAAIAAAPARAKAPLAGKQAPGVYRVRVGTFEVTVLNDGVWPIEIKNFSDPASVAGKLEAAHLRKDVALTSVNEWLVNTGDKLILIDTGATGLAAAPQLGRLPRNLAAAAVEPASVDSVILTHMHPDHAGGLLTLDKKILFPNASVHVNEVELGFWSSDEIYSKAPPQFKFMFDYVRAAIKPYKDAGKVVTYKDGATFLPGIGAIMAPGHTVGHTMIRLASERKELLLWGDIVHSAALQFADPDLTLTFDTDPAMAIATRKRVFDMAVNEKLVVAGAHLPFPGLGYVDKAAAGHIYLPSPWSEELAI